MRHRKKRRLGPLGTHVLVCGQPVSREKGLICLLPTEIPHRTHVSIAVSTDNTLVLAFRHTGSKETEWQLVEADQAEQSMSPEQP